VQAQLGQCLPLRLVGEGAGGAEQTLGEPLRVWCIDNFAATFATCSPSEGKPSGERTSLSVDMRHRAPCLLPVAPFVNKGQDAVDAFRSFK
jgi:hypothetical protein